MNAKVFRQNIEQLRSGLDVCLSKRLQMPALILIYSWIDIMGWLNSSDPKEKVQTSFTRWVSTYLLPPSTLPCSAEELYGARCGILHRLAADSNLSEKGKVRRVMYSWGAAQAHALQRRADSEGMTSEYVAVQVEDLAAALHRGLDANMDALSKDELKASAFFSRVGQWFQHFSIEETGRLLQGENTE